MRAFMALKSQQRAGFLVRAGVVVILAVMLGWSASYLWADASVPAPSALSPPSALNQANSANESVSIFLPVDLLTAALLPESGRGDPPAGHGSIGDGGGWDGTLRRIAVPVLMYHYVSVPPEDADIYRQDLSVRPDVFRAQMQYLADNGYTVISLYDLNLALRWGAALPPLPVVLTFDDGYVDMYTEVFPVLQEYGYTATFFVITSRLDEGNPDYITWAQAREMAAAGMSIESHTRDHLSLPEREPEFLYDQIQGSMEDIAARTGYQPHLFCYPGGRWDESVLESLRAMGVWAAVTTEGGIEQTTDAILLLPRARVSGDTDMPTFAALLRWDWDHADS